MIDLFTPDAFARVVSENDDFGIRYDVYAFGKKVYSSPFLHDAKNFVAEYNSLLQLPY